MMDPFNQAVWLSTALLLAGGLAVVTYSILRGFRQRDLILAASAVIFLGALALRLPVQPAGLSFLEQLALAAVDALRYFTMDVPYEAIGFSGSELLSAWYRYLDVTLNFVAPLCTTMILLSVLQMLGWVRFRLCFWRPVYCFSELNERSFAMANSVMEDWSTGKGDFFKPVLVFFKTEPHDDSVELQYRAEAQRLGAAFYRDPIHAVRLPDPWLRRVKVFLIDKDEDSNMGTATRMKDWICPNRKRRFPGHYTDSDILVFSTRESSEIVFDKLLAELKTRRERLLGQRRAKREDARIDLHLVNETKLIAQKLLWEHPLYETLESPTGDDISMLMVGGGRLGMEILRTAMVCGVMDTCRFHATVIDAEGERLRRQFQHTYGSLPESIRDAVKFREADVDCTSFDRLLEDPELEPNYIVVATGDDERNVTTAQFLQRYYARRTIRDGDLLKAPKKIYVAIRDQGRYEALEALRADGLELFGCHADIFRREVVLDRPIDRVAMLFHSAYNARGKTLDPTLMLPRTQNPFQWYLTRLLNLWEPMKRSAKHRYYSLSAVDLHSNQIVVMHSIYKFRDMLYRNGCLKQYQEDLGKDPARAFALLVWLMSDDRETLYRLEHRRWEVFQTLDGWQPFPLDRIEVYAAAQTEGKQALPGLNQHKHMIARLHGCLTPYDALPPLAEKLNTLYGLTGEKQKEFLEYDRVMCVNSLIAWLDLVADQTKVENLRNLVREILTQALDEEGKSSADRTLNYLKAHFPDPRPQKTA
ncbi:MAG: hypothetical protein IKC09_05715 [Oscillospiraceae bacterium]|nr:hypothetical protein [Oscillospiraceae bacterium]